MRYKTLWPFALLSLAACNTTSEMPLASNVWQIETNSRGLLFTGSANKQTLKKAAERTLAQGYSHFVLVDAHSQSGQVYVGSTPTTVNSSYTASHNYTYGRGVLAGTAQGNMYGTVNTGTPLYAPTKDIKVTVIMLQADDPRAANALDAAAILAAK